MENCAGSVAIADQNGLYSRGLADCQPDGGLAVSPACRRRRAAVAAAAAAAAASSASSEACVDGRD